MTLPHGFRVRLVPGLLTADNGRLLVGGSPLVAMRLTKRAQAKLENGEVTVTDPDSAHVADRLLATNLGLPDLAEIPAVAEHDLTVVIPVRDRPDQLDRTLSALHPLHCVVVDDASLDPEPVAVVARRHEAQVISLPVNVGPAGARNAGLATVSTPYVAFVDSDVEIAGSEVTRLARHFADPAVSLVGPRISGIARSADPRWFERYDAEASSLTLGTTPGTVQPGAAVAWLPSACLVARTAAIAPGFDPELRVGEDVDLVWRLVEAGHRVRYDPTIEAHHDARQTMHGWLGRKFVYGSGGAALAARHGNKLAPAVLTPSCAIAAAALLLRNRWTIPVATMALASGTRSVRAALPDAPGRDAIASRLAVRGLVWAVRQESALLLRHWWPAALVAAARSQHLRRALVSALVVDAAVAMSERPTEAQLGPAALVAGRRLDDLAYGAGLWSGAVRAHSPRVLRPRVPLSPRGG